jgi:hypothetical protein
MKFIARKNNQEIEMSYSDIGKYKLSAGFMSMLENMKIGERMFNYDIMTEFERIS